MTTSRGLAAQPGKATLAVGLWEFLVSELAPRPGRLADVLRIVALTVLTVILGETFRLPLIDYSAYVVFFVSKEEKVTTTLIGIFATLGITLAVLATLAVYMVSAGEPGLRLPLMALAAFIGIFFSRVSTLGPIAFLVGFLMTIALTLIDVMPGIAPLPNAELLTRTVLWLWVVVMLPVGLVVGANILLGRRPEDLFRQVLAEHLADAANQLLDAQDAAAFEDSRDGSPLRAWTVELQRYLKLSSRLRRSSPGRTAAGQALVERIHELRSLTSEWGRLAVTDPVLLAMARTCGRRLLAVARSVETESDLPAGAPPDCTVEEGLFETAPAAALVLERLLGAADQFPGLLRKYRHDDSDNTAAKSETSTARQLLAPDAFSNPEHVRFALKTTLCAFTTYIAYSLLGWPEIRTAMITCFFVTIGTIGETVHKMTLRIAGALIGGVTGLATVIFLMPALTSIGELCLVIGAMSFIAAWIATSSERLSYAGMQIALAYFFCVLVGYGPTVDLAMARDRVVGILFGNLVVWLVFTTIWPVGIAAKARDALAKAFGSLADVFQKEQWPGPRVVDASVLDYDNALEKAWRFCSFSPFEPPSVREPTLDASDVEVLQSLLGPMIVLEGNAVSPLAIGDAERPLAEAEAAYIKAVGSWLSGLAQRFSSDGLQGALGMPPDVVPVVASLEQAGPGPGQARLRARGTWYRELGQRLLIFERLLEKRLSAPHYGTVGKQGAVS